MPEGAFFPGYVFLRIVIWHRFQTISADEQGPVPFNSKYDPLDGLTPLIRFLGIPSKLNNFPYRGVYDRPESGLPEFVLHHLQLAFTVFIGADTLEQALCFFQFFDRILLS